MFCRCGKLMTMTDTGYECICGLKKDFEGNDLSADDAEKIADVKKKYHSKYPNMNDELIRGAKPYEEDETTDETFSSLTPSELERKREKMKKKNGETKR